jgi:glyoxylase I family protein
MFWRSAVAVRTPERPATATAGCGESVLSPCLRKIKEEVKFKGKEERVMSLFLSLEHPAVAAQDSEALMLWYRGIFNGRIVYQSESKPHVYVLKLEGGWYLEILPARPGSPRYHESAETGWRHMALAVAGFDQAKEYLRGQGVELFDQRESEGFKLIFFRDPEGNLLHLIWREHSL